MLRLNQLSSQVGDKFYDYIIVGAGLGGLYAAKLLAQNGITNFLILEAQEGVGGRIETIKLGEIVETNKYTWIRKNNFLCNFAIEKGATWIEESHTLMLHLASTLGIKIRKQFRKGMSTYVAKDRIYTCQDLLTLQQIQKPIRDFLDKFRVLSQEYIENVVDKLSIDEKYRQMVLKFDNMTIAQYLDVQISSPFVRNFLYNLIEHTECIDLKLNSMHEVLLKGSKSEDIQILTEFLGVGDEPSYLINGGSSMYLQKIQQSIENAAKVSRNKLIRFNEAVVEINNSMKGNIKIKASKNGKIITYACKQVILTIPIGILNSIQITNLSLAKRLIFTHQTRNIVAKSFIITRRPFWKDKCSGDGLYSQDYNISMSHDISPENNQCGVLVFFHCGEKYTKWHQQFPLETPNRSQAIRKFYIKLLAKIYLQGNEDSPELEELIYVNACLMDNKFVLSGFQSNCKPGTLTSLMSMGQVFHKYYEDENGLIFLGSEFSQEFNSYMEGAVRSASKKIHELLNKPDPMIQLKRNIDEKKNHHQQIVEGVQKQRQQ